MANAKYASELIDLLMVALRRFRTVRSIAPSSGFYTAFDYLLFVSYDGQA
jgi:hypothetical protein